MPKTFMDLKSEISDEEIEPDRIARELDEEDGANSIPWDLDEIREMSVAQRLPVLRTWALIAINTLKELKKRNRKFDTKFVKSVESQMRYRFRGAPTDAQADALWNIISKFRVEAEFRKQCEKGRRIVTA